MSSEFVRVAKAVAKGVAIDTLKTKACKNAPAQNRETCQAVVDAAAGAISMAVDGQFDDELLTATLVEISVKLTHAAAAHAATEVMVPLLDEVSRLLVVARPQCKLTGRSLAPPLSRCLVEQSLGTSPAPSCQALANVLREAGPSCGFELKSAGNATLQSSLDALHAGISGMVGAGKNGYHALATIQTLRAVLQGAYTGGFYRQATILADHYEEFFAFLDSTSDQSIFYDDELTIPTLATGEAPCSNAAAVEAQVATWQKDKLSVFTRIVGSLARGTAVDRATLDRVPASLGDPQCPAATHSTKVWADRVRRYANTYRGDVLLVAELDRIVYPALAASLVLDFITSQDTKRFRDDLTDLSLRLAARAIAASDPSAWSCNKDVCARLPGDTGPAPAPIPFAGLPGTPDDQSTWLLYFVEERASPRAARRTCLYQMLAAALHRPVQLGTSRVCRKTVDGMAVAGAALAGTMAPHPGVPQLLAEWSASALEPVRKDWFRIRVSTELSAPDSWKGLADLFDRVQFSASSQLYQVQRTLRAAFQVLGSDREADARRMLLSEGARRLEPMVDGFLDDTIYKVADASKDGSLVGGVRILIGAIYRPVLAYIQIENPSEADRRRLAFQAYQKILELDPLSRTPILLNVGLGVTGLTRFDDASLHLTLLDKVGLAVRCGDRNNFEAGVFVGGFLDAIIREASDAEDQQPYWIAGATAGVRSITPSFPIGVGLHLGVAMPFNLDRFEHTVAGAAGLALTIPVDTAFGD